MRSTRRVVHAGAGVKHTYVVNGGAPNTHMEIQEAYHRTHPAILVQPGNGLLPAHTTVHMPHKQTHRPQHSHVQSVYTHIHTNERQYTHTNETPYIYTNETQYRHTNKTQYIHTHTHTHTLMKHNTHTHTHTH